MSVVFGTQFTSFQCDVSTSLAISYVLIGCPPGKVMVLNNFSPVTLQKLPVNYRPPSALGNQPI